jgi:Gly-Xaa carboxypeptidase
LSNLTSIRRTTIETLIAQGFKPTRTVVIAFGFDEEVSGPQGAKQLGAAMRSIYGENLPFAFVLDEGGKWRRDHIFDSLITGYRGFR